MGLTRRLAARIMLLAALAALLTTTAACSAPKNTPAANGSPSPTAGARSLDRYLGWWETDQSLVYMVRITRQDAAYRLGGLVGADLSPLGGSLHGDLSGGLGRVVFRLAPGGRQLFARWILAGKPGDWVRYVRAPSDEVSDFITNGNMNRLAFAIADWQQRMASYPPVAAVRRDGALGRTVRPWPVNPYSGRPIAPGSAPGDYRYRTTKDGFVLVFQTPRGSMRTVEKSQATQQP